MYTHPLGGQIKSNTLMLLQNLLAACLQWSHSFFVHQLLPAQDQETFFALGHLSHTQPMTWTTLNPTKNNRHTYTDNDHNIRKKYTTDVLQKRRKGHSLEPSKIIICEIWTGIHTSQSVDSTKSKVVRRGLTTCNIKENLINPSVKLCRSHKMGCSNALCISTHPWRHMGNMICLNHAPLSACPLVYWRSWKEHQGAKLK